MLERHHSQKHCDSSQECLKKSKIITKMTDDIDFQYYWYIHAVTIQCESAKPDLSGPSEWRHHRLPS